MAKQEIEMTREEIKRQLTETIKVRNLKAYSVVFTLPSEIDYGENELHKITIIAHNSDEAEEIFTKYAIAKKLYDEINKITIESQLKTKENKHLINKDFYIKQNDFVNKLFEEFNNK